MSLAASFRTLLYRDITAKNAGSFAKRHKAFAILCVSFVLFAVDER
jgi:hypothetical protein